MVVIQTAGEPTAKPTEIPGPAPAKIAKPHASLLARKIASEIGVDLSKLTGTGPGGLIDREDVEHAASPTPAIQTGAVRVKISPLARRLAAELHVDLSTVHGTGPEGIIERIDVEKAATTKKGGTEKSGEGMRRAIAAAMAKSNRESPHYYLQTRIDMSSALKWLEETNQKRALKDRLRPTVLLIKAVAKALRDVPGLNGFWIDNEPHISKAIHLGFAISMKGGGLVAPAIHDVDQMTCDGIMAALHDLIPRARSGRLRSSEMTDATMTVTSLGVESVFGVIYPPQVGLIGFGRIMEQPWARDGMLGVHPVMTASLAADHRATDGHLGAQFLDALNRHFQSPESL